MYIGLVMFLFPSGSGQLGGSLAKYRHEDKAPQLLVPPSAISEWFYLKDRQM